MKTKRKKKWLSILIGLSVFALFLKLMGWGFSSSKIIISYQTTRITSPLDDKGNVDYLEYINQQAAEGVTPQNNFEYVVRKVTGVEIINENIRAEYLKRIGLKEEDIFKKEDRYQNLIGFLKMKLGENPEKYPDKVSIMDRIDEFYKVLESPWEEKEAPLVADWLKKYSKHLDLIAEATKRPHDYIPYYIASIELVDTDINVSSLINVSLAPVQERRNFSREFRARALNRLFKGDLKGAQDDTLTLHRMAKLTNDHSAFVIEMLIGIAIDANACFADLVMLEHENITKKEVMAYLNQLNKFKRQSNITHYLDEENRFLFLDSIIQLSKMTNPSDSIFSDEFMSKYFQSTFDLNSMLKWGNQQFDSLVAIAELKDPVEILKRFEEESEQADKRARNFLSWSTLWNAGTMKKFISDRIRDQYYVLLMPSLDNLVKTKYSSDFKFNSTKVAYALKAYQLDHKNYPENLAQLVPEYLPEIPPDPFSGQEPIYKTTEKGFLIYSVGPNQKDEKGIGPRGLMEGDYNLKDDIAIQFPTIKNP